MWRSAFLVYVLFFFFKQKTAYEMRISDWSSDVCSSDLQPSEAGSHAATRYRDQARRVFEVLDRHLSTRDWLAAGRYTIADVATYPWVGSLTGLGFDWNDYPSLHAWFERLSARPAAIRLAAFRDRILSAIPAVLHEAGIDRKSTRLNS